MLAYMKQMSPEPFAQAEAIQADIRAAMSWWFAKHLMGGYRSGVSRRVSEHRNRMVEQVRNGGNAEDSMRRGQHKSEPRFVRDVIVLNDQGGQS